MSAVARIEQNFAQAYTGITPGDDFDIDWGIGKIVKLGGHAFDIGVSGFSTMQVSTQSGGPSVGRYRYNGAGPEISTPIADGWAVRVRAQWEYEHGKRGPGEQHLVHREQAVLTVFVSSP